MKYAHYDKTHKILGYYDSHIHKHIPEPNISISDEIWQKAIAENATHVDLINNTLYVKIEQLSEVELLNNAKENKFKELEIWFENMKNHSKINLIGFGLIDGGYKYLLNARAMVNNFDLLIDKSFRMLDNSFKTITLEDLKNIHKAIEVAGIKLHAIKWGYEKAISEATTLEQLEAIRFNDTIEVELNNE